MAKTNKKPKFLEKETPELLAMLKEVLSGDEVDEKKALKITDELINRQPTEEGPMSVDEALQSAAEVMTEVLNKIKAAYDNEVNMIEDAEEEETETEAIPEEEEEPVKPAKKEKKSKKSKKDPEPEPEEDEEEADEDDDGEDYSDWSTKDLKKECRSRGIKVTKSMGKADLVKALEADDEE
jgi:hypothetical protein